jgi:hypothetical protein
MRLLHAAALALPLVASRPARALPPPVGVSIEAALPAAPGPAGARLALVTSAWLTGDLEGEARLGLGSAARPGGRATGVVTPAVGLRWVPDAGRWRPLIGAELGVRCRAPGPSTALTTAARAGVELLPRRRLSLSLAVGWRWNPGATSGAEVVLGLGFAP